MWKVLERCGLTRAVRAATAAESKEGAVSHVVISTDFCGLLYRFPTNAHTDFRSLYSPTSDCCTVPVSRISVSDQRHSAIEVHPNFSEAPHSRSSIPHPKTCFSKKSKFIATNNPMARAYKSFFFRNSRLTFRQFGGGQGTPSFRNKIAERCYLYRRTGHHVLITDY